MPDSVTMSLTLELLQTQFPDAKLIDLKRAIKYQDKFQYTAANIKCINPSCSLLRKWSGATYRGFNYTCSKSCELESAPLIKELKLKNTVTANLIKYGYPNPMQKKEIKEKLKQTYLLKTGFSNPSCDPKIKHKKLQTSLKNFGCDNPMQKKEIKLKSNRTNLIKYGCTSSKQTHLTNLQYWNDKEFWIENFIINNNFDLYKCRVYFNCGQPAAHNQIKKLGVEYSKFGGTSLKEQQLASYIQELGYEVNTNNRSIIKPLELDIYIPALKLAVEYNGLYWHSTEAGTDKYYHQQKSLACIAAGISLVHLYETDTYEKNISKIQDAIKFKLEPRATEVAFSYVLDTGCYPESINMEEYLIIEPKIKTESAQFQVYDSGQLQLRPTTERTQI